MRGPINNIFVSIHLTSRLIKVSRYLFLFIQKHHTLTKGYTSVGGTCSGRDGIHCLEQFMEPFIPLFLFFFFFFKEM